MEGKNKTDASVDLLKSFTTLNFPVSLKPQGLPSLERDKEQAEITFKFLFDPQTKQINKLGQQLCSEFKVPTETLLLKKFQDFVQKFGDEEIADLHHKHYVNRRQKNLLRIAQRLNELSSENPKTTRNSLETLSPQSKFLQLSSSQLQSSSGQKINTEEILYKQHKNNFEKAIRIVSDRQTKEKIVEANLKQVLKEKKEKMHNLVEKAKLVTDRAKQEQKQFERTSYKEWRNYLKEVDERVGKVDRSQKFDSSSRNLSQPLQPINRNSVGVLTPHDDRQIDDYLEKYEYKVKDGRMRAQEWQKNQSHRAQLLNNRVDQMRMTGIPSLVKPGTNLTQANAKEEKLIVEKFSKLFKTESRLSNFFYQQKRLESEERDVRAKLYSERSQTIKSMRKSQKLELLQLELSLEKKQKLKEELRQKLATVANRDVMIRKEKTKLKELELKQYMEEVQVERRMQQTKILKKHIALDEQLKKQKQAQGEYFKQLELERKNKLIHDFNERQVSNERRTAIETEVIKAEEKRKKLAKEAAAREK